MFLAMPQAREVKAYCEEGHTCRRVTLLRHFGEQPTSDVCRGMCDVCSPINGDAEADAPGRQGGGPRSSC